MYNSWGFHEQSALVLQCGMPANSLLCTNLYLSVLFVLFFFSSFVAFSLSIVCISLPRNRNSGSFSIKRVKLKTPDTHAYIQSIAHRNKMKHDNQTKHKWNKKSNKIFTKKKQILPTERVKREREKRTKEKNRMQNVGKRSNKEKTKPN